MPTPNLPPAVQRLIDDLIEREGDYTNHPSDKGGPTRFGITEAIARGQGYHGEMRLLPRSLAVEIYRDIYFSGPGLDRLHAVMPRLAEELVDTGANMGPDRAIRFFQRGLNVCNRQGRDYPDVALDGRIGPRTVAAVLAFRQRRGDDAEKVLFRICEGFQRVRYVEICEGRQANEDFAFGWIMNRTGDLKEFAQ